MNLTLSLIRGRREVPVCFQMAKESGPRDHQVWVRVIRQRVRGQVVGGLCSFCASCPPAPLHVAHQAQR